MSDQDTTAPSGGSTQDTTVDAETLIENLLEETPDEDTSIRALREDMESLKSALARAQADYQNLTGRMDREKADMSFFLTKTILLKMLPFADNLERALKHCPKDLAGHPWVAGIEGTYANLKKTFQSLHTDSFDSIGVAADAHRHEVIASAPGVDGIIIDELERGYTLRGEILRHAKVVVGNGQPTAETEASSAQV